MARLDRHIRNRWVGLFLPSLAVLMAVYLVGDAAFGVWDLVRIRLPLSQVLTHFLLKLPNIFYLMAPVASLLATLLTLTAMKRSGEMGALFFGGVSRFRLSFPILSVTLVVSFLSLAVNERLAPLANRLSMDIVRGATGKLHTVVGREGIWLLRNGTVIHIRNVEEKGVLLIGPTVLTFSDAGLASLASRIDSPEARWSEGKWVMEGALLRRFSRNVPTGKEGPRRISADLGIQPQEFFRVRRTPEEMSRRELTSYVDNLKMAGLKFYRYEVRIHRNLSVAFLPFVFALIALPVGFLVPVRGGVPLGTAASMLLVMVFWSLYSFTLTLGSAGTLEAPVAAWGVVVLFVLVGVAALAATRRIRLT